MHHRPVRFRLLPAILITCGLVLDRSAATFAQQNPGYGQGGGMHRFGNGGRGGGGGSQSFDPVVVDGPPAPDSMSQLVGLDESGFDRYKTLYENLMSSTQPQRDSLAALRQAWRSGGAGGGGADASGEGRRGGGMRGPASDLRAYLQDRQQQFDQALADILTSDQMKKYRDWRDQVRKAAQDRMRQMRSGQNGGGPES